MHHKNNYKISHPAPFLPDSTILVRHSINEGGLHFDFCVFKLTISQFEYISNIPVQKNYEHSLVIVRN